MRRRGENWEGFPSPADYGVQGRRKLPCRVSGAEPSQKRFWYIFSLKEDTMATNCLEYGITVNNDSVNTGIDKRNHNADVHGDHGSASLTIWRLNHSPLKLKAF